jgi:hypothetical protein
MLRQSLIAIVRQSGGEKRRMRTEDEPKITYQPASFSTNQSPQRDISRDLVGEVGGSNSE